MQKLLFQLALALENYNYVSKTLEQYPTFCDSSDVEKLMFVGIETKDLDIVSTCVKYFEQYEEKHPALRLGVKAQERFKRITSLENNFGFNVEGINQLSGIDFELLVINAFKKLGFTVEETPASGDYGADVLLETANGTRIVVQCKRFKSKVNLKAVQEVLGAVGHYDCDYALVITNNAYLNSAIKLADSNDVELWGGDELLKLLSGEISFSDISSF